MWIVQFGLSVILWTILLVGGIMGINEHAKCDKWSSDLDSYWETWNWIATGVAIAALAYLGGSFFFDLPTPAFFLHLINILLVFALFFTGIGIVHAHNKCVKASSSMKTNYIFGILTLCAAVLTIFIKWVFPIIHKVAKHLEKKAAEKAAVLPTAPPTASKPVAAAVLPTATKPVAVAAPPTKPVAVAAPVTAPVAVAVLPTVLPTAPSTAPAAGYSTRFIQPSIWI